jgi:hypothetical protein
MWITSGVPVPEPRARAVEISPEINRAEGSMQAPPPHNISYFRRQVAHAKARAASRDDQVKISTIAPVFDSILNRLDVVRDNKVVIARERLAPAQDFANRRPRLVCAVVRRRSVADYNTRVRLNARLSIDLQNKPVRTATRICDMKALHKTRDSADGNSQIGQKALVHPELSRTEIYVRRLNSGP